jgi:orotate phosphoribosyltransferase/GNAT superfamily N-acetyltransferase
VNPSIRQATPHDTEAVSEILGEAAHWLEQSGSPMWKGDELSPLRIADDVASGLFYIAEIDSELAGTIKFQLEDNLFWPDVSQPESAFVHRLAVRRRFAGGIVSSALLRWAVERARALGRRYLRLDCEASRTRLRQVYERFGFRHHSDRHVGPYFVSRYQFETGQENPKRIPPQSPGLRGTSYPGGAWNLHNPEGVAQILSSPPVHDDVLSLFASQKGHFRYESGHHGNLWLNLELLCLRPARVKPFAVKLARQLAPYKIEAVCGPLVEGALIAQMVAEELEVEFFYAERFVEPSSISLYPVNYRLPGIQREKIRGQRVAIVNDVINAGSAVRGTFADLVDCRAQPVALGSLLVLGPTAATFAAEWGMTLETLVSMPNALWVPSECPLCGYGVPLDNEEEEPDSEHDAIG